MAHKTPIEATHATTPSLHHRCQFNLVHPTKHRTIGGIEITIILQSPNGTSTQ